MIVRRFVKQSQSVTSDTALVGLNFIRLIMLRPAIGRQRELSA